MPIVSIDIPTAAVTRIQTAFTSEFGYQETITNEDGTTSPNPVTKNQFFKQQLINYVKQVTRNYEANLAAASARQTKEAEVNSVNIT